MRGWRKRLSAAWYRGDRWLWLLWPLELLFRILSYGRRAAYAIGLLPSWSAPVPVIVVGNITVGGSGKTPLVQAIVKHLQQQGMHPGIVSRGYGGKPGFYPFEVTAETAPEHSGDEPLLLVQNTAAPCMVGPNRVAAVKKLLLHHSVDVVVSDDGLQHYRLGRNIEIAVVDAQQMLGNEHCLPMGPLREPMARLKTVDRVVYRGIELGSGFVLKPLRWVSVSGNETMELSELRPDEAVYAIAGIGHPQQFFDTLTELQLRFDCRTFSDHHAYCAADFAGLGGRTLVMTQKDAVKCRRLVGPNAWYLEVEASLPVDIRELLRSRLNYPRER